jgi:hypothetical protein
MRITDIAIMPFEIEVTTEGYTLLKVGIVETGENKGAKKEMTMGYYSRGSNGFSTMLAVIIKDKIISEKDKMTLKGYLSEYQKHLKYFTELLEKILK